MLPSRKAELKVWGVFGLWIAFSVVASWWWVPYLIDHARLLESAHTHLQDRSLEWRYTVANEPTCAQLRDDYRNGHTEFFGYNRGYAEALEGFALSHGEQLCMQRLTPEALKKHMEVRSFQQKVQP